MATQTRVSPRAGILSPAFEDKRNELIELL
jgi:hypothetical protein